MNHMCMGSIIEGGSEARKIFAETGPTLTLLPAYSRRGHWIDIKE